MIKVATSDGITTLRRGSDALDNGVCGAGDLGTWEGGNFRLLFGQLMNSRDVRTYVPLLAAMLTRCDPALTDIFNGAVNGLFGQLGARLRPSERLPIGPTFVPDSGPRHGGTPLPMDSIFSGPLQSTVIATTMLRADATPEQAELDALRHFATIFRPCSRGPSLWSLLPPIE